VPDSSDVTDLALALSLADAADQVTMSRFGAADLRVDAKPDLTPVTDADRDTEQLLRDRLAQRRPADAIVGEEFTDTGSAARRWVLDPIDGTKNFVRGVPVWATLIGLLDGDSPLLGVVSAPALGRRWWAECGGGAWCTALGAPARRLRVSGVSDLADASLAYSEITEWERSGRLAPFLELCRRVWRTRGFGDFWSYMLVAEGAVDLAAEPELALWDMAALAPIVREAGGAFTGLNGRPGPGHGSAVASNGLLHQAFLAALNPSAS
jgi:histidinol-phosphatase